MNCKEISNKICDLLEKYKEHNMQLQSLIIRKQEGNDESWITDDLDLNNFNEDTSFKINTFLNELYKKSEVELFNFFDAPLSVYKGCFDVNLNAFLFSYKDASKSDYLERELKQLNDPVNNRILIGKNREVYNYHHFINDNFNFEVSLKKKKEYLKTRIGKAGFDIKEKDLMSITKKEFIILNKNKKPLNHQYLVEFCKSISNSNDINDASFIHNYKHSITHFTPYLEKEIIGNLLQLKQKDKLLYLDYVKATITETPYANLNTEYFTFWLNEYNETIENFPYFKKGKLYTLLNTYCQSMHLEYEDSLHFKELQKDFFRFASYIEVKKVLQFLKTYYSKLNTNKNAIMKNNEEESNKLKWVGKPSQLGFIISNLVSMGYIESPLKKDGEINYTQLAKLVKETFETETTESTLSKYLNLESEKGQETVRKFNSNNFNIPHLKTIS